MIPSLLLLGCSSGPVGSHEGVPRLEELTKEQYGMLPDTAPIVMDGTRTTKADIRAQSLHRRDQALEQFRSEFLQLTAKEAHERQQAMDLEQASFAAQSMASPETTRASSPVSPDRIASIRKEAEALVARARTASPTDLEAIDRRAGELLRQLQNRR